MISPHALQQALQNPPPPQEPIPEVFLGTFADRISDVYRRNTRAQLDAAIEKLPKRTAILSDGRRAEML